MFERASIALALFAFAHSLPNGDPPSKLWTLCATAGTIVTGTLHVPVKELRQASRSGGRYLTATVDVADVLKGERADATAVTFYTEDRSYAPKREQLIALDGKPVLLFLSAVPDSASPAKTSTYFAGYTADALRALSVSEVEEIRAEIARQQRVLRTWRPHPEWPHEAEVKQLIEKMLVRETQMRAFKDLEDLGAGAVPAIIDLMDDRRPLGNPLITLDNPPGAFETHRIYGPKLVVDALAAILNQMTGTAFGPSISNGGSEVQRQRVVDGWRIYADVHAPATSPAGGAR